MLVCLFEDDRANNLYPLTRTRAACSLRIGHRTILDTVAETLDTKQIVVHCRPELADVAREETDCLVNRIADGVDVLFINGRVALGSRDQLAPVLEATRSATPRVFIKDGAIAAAWIPADQNPADLLKLEPLSPATFRHWTPEVLGDISLVERTWHLIRHIESAIEFDFAELSHGINLFERPDTVISERADLINSERIYVGPGAEIRSGAVLDATAGAIIIGRDAVVMEHAVIHGPVSIGEHSIVKVGTQLEACTVGPWCKVAGELHHSVMHSYSNKSHAGFLGHSYLGSWVNLGAHTNTSNLKNDYGLVSAFNESLGEMETTGGIFAGLVMGDHSKCGIDSMFNTGTVVGVSCNLYGTGYHPRYIPSYLWGGPQTGFVPYRLEKALSVASTVMQRRGRQLSLAAKELLTRVYEETVADRDRGPVR